MRDVGAGADGDPEIGLCQRRRVVDAVADHRDDRAARLQLARRAAALSRRQDLGHDPLRTDADLRPRWPPRSSRRSPVSIQTSTPARSEPRHGLGGARLDRVGEADDADRRARRARPTATGRRPEVAARRPVSTPASARNAARADQDRRAVDRGAHARDPRSPRRRSASGAVDAARRRRVARSPRPADARCRARPRPRAAGARRSETPGAGSTTRDRRLGRAVIVPVLSRTTAVTRCASSSAAPSRMRMPFSAPLPVPTMIAVGVARPIAQGQAMMRTAIAVDSANGRLGSGPKSSQTAKVRAATPSTAGTNQPVTRSATRWIGAFEPCARSTRLTIWASVVSRPTRSARMTNEPARVERRADDAGRRRPSRPGSARR